MDRTIRNLLIGGTLAIAAMMVAVYVASEQPHDFADDSVFVAVAGPPPSHPAGVKASPGVGDNSTAETQPLPDALVLRVGSA